MSEEDIELARRLLTKAGMIFEDASTIALLAQGDDRDAAATLRSMIDRSAALISAAQTLQNQSPLKL